MSRVTSTINAENAAASTTFEVTNLRTNVEDLESTRFSLESPPFFEEGFYGAPLVSTLDVEPVGGSGITGGILGGINPDIGGIA